MPQYEFNNKETGESVGELFLSLEGLEDFLRQNPNLCVAPGKLRYLQFKSDESFPSYPDMDNQTRTVEEKDPNFVPAQPASWSDRAGNPGRGPLRHPAKSGCLSHEWSLPPNAENPSRDFDG